MIMIELINKNNEKTTYTRGRTSAIMMRKCLEIRETCDFKNPTGEQLDKMVDFIVEAYNNQFTRNDFYRGVDMDKFMIFIMKTMNEIIQTLSKVANSMEGEGQGVNP